MGTTVSSGFPRLLHGAIPFLMAMTLVYGARGQDRSFSITATAGYGFLSLNAVDAKNASDVEGWGRLGIPVSTFASVKHAPYVSGRITYRSSRDFSFSIYGSYFSNTVSSNHHSQDAVLQLDRSVGATDLTLGISYYPALQPYFMEWYLQAHVGVIFARARARAVGSQASKPAGVIIMIPLVDSEGIYRKTKTSALFFVGADLPLAHPLFFKGEVGYRVAQVGEMNGDIRRFDVQSSESSITVFDFSGILINIGVGFQL